MNPIQLSVWLLLLLLLHIVTIDVLIFIYLLILFINLLFNFSRNVNFCACIFVPSITLYLVDGYLIFLTILYANTHTKHAQTYIKQLWLYTWCIILRIVVARVALSWLLVKTNVKRFFLLKDIFFIIIN